MLQIREIHPALGRVPGLGLLGGVALVGGRDGQPHHQLRSLLEPGGDGHIGYVGREMQPGVLQVAGLGHRDVDLHSIV